MERGTGFVLLSNKTVRLIQIFITQSVESMQEEVDYKPPMPRRIGPEQEIFVPLDGGKDFEVRIEYVDMNELKGHQYLRIQEKSSAIMERDLEDIISWND